MSSSIDQPTPVLPAGELRLDPLDPSVLEQYLQMLADPESQRLTGTKQKFTREKIIDWLNTRSEQTNRFDWAIKDSTDAFLGEIVLNEYNEKQHSMNLRICLRDPAIYNRGIGSAALSAVSTYVFDELKLNKVTLSVLVDNPRAISLYEKYGFEPKREYSEGKLRYLRMTQDRYDFVRALAERKIAEHLDLENWNFAFDSAKRRAGLCDYTSQTISISRYHVDLHSIDDTMQVVLHEIAHGMCGSKAGHSKTWLKTAKSIGYRAEKFTGQEIAQNTAGWVGHCPRGHKHYRYRRPTRMLSCTLCGPGFSAANLIRWNRREDLLLED